MIRMLYLGIVASTLAIGTSYAADSNNKDKPELKELESVEALKTQFNADSGKRRLLLLLSPT